MAEQQPQHQQPKNKNEVGRGFIWLAGSIVATVGLLYTPTYNDWSADNKAIHEKSGPATAYVKQELGKISVPGASALVSEVGPHTCDRDLKLLSFPPDSNDAPRHCATKARVVLDFSIPESATSYSKTWERVSTAVTAAGLQTNHYIGAGDLNNAQRVHFAGQDFTAGTDWNIHQKTLYNQGNGLYKIDGVPQASGTGYLVELIIQGFSVDYGQTNYVNNHGH